MGLHDRPIEQKIFLLIMPICLIPALVFVVLIGWGARLTFEQTMGTELSRRNSDLAAQLDQFLGGRLNSLRLISARHRNQPLRLAEQAQLATGAQAVVIVESNGTVQYLAGPPQMLDLLRSREVLFKSWWASKDQVPDKGILDDLTLTEGTSPTGAQSLLTMLILPGPSVLQREGLLFFVYPSGVLVQQFVQSLPQAPEFYAVFSAQGYPLYVSRQLGREMEARLSSELERLESSSSWFATPWNQQSVLMALARSPEMARQRQQLPNAALWTSVIHYDMENFLGPQDTLIWLAVLIALGLVLAMLAVASVCARALTRPLRSLRAQAEQFAQGNLQVRVSVPWRDEIGQLAHTFNTMASRLQATYRSLQERSEENRLRAEHIHAINEVANAIIQCSSLDSIFDILREELEAVIPFDALWIARFDRDGNDLRITHIHPMGLITLFDRGKLPLDWSLHSQVTQRGETLHAEIGPQHRNEIYETRIFQDEGFQSYLIAPLPSRDGLMGTLTVASTMPDAYNSELASIMTSIAKALAIAIEQADLFQRISQFAAELERKVSERTQELDLATKKLITAEKYHATGRMAGNLAHEINNPLGIIKNYLKLVRNRMEQAGGGRRKTDPSLDHLQIIDEEVNRIARLVRQLLDLHRPAEQAIAPVDMNAMLKDILHFMQHGFGRHGITLHTELEPDLPEPVVSGDLLRQVLINLLRNAQEAMEEDGGQLHVRTWTGVAWEGRQQRPQVCISITDTGTGIQPEHVSQIFDPFFSTKPPEKGSGLGLCVSYGIVRMYEGSIDVQSQPGQGTCFTVMLPCPGAGVQTPENTASSPPRNN